jgi:hypothetical protein
MNSTLITVKQLAKGDFVAFACAPKQRCVIHYQYLLRTGTKVPQSRKSA